MENWNLIKKIDSLDLTKKVFELSDLPKSEKHEEHIDHFTEVLEERGHEIFKVEGHQFVTSDGVYIIAHKSEIGE